MSNIIWIGYTTLYREGGPQFERAALTLAREKRAAHPALRVRCERIESKQDFVSAMARIRADGDALEELHFIGHSGMYGPMFRTTSMPEQFSPHEWRTLKSNNALPFSATGTAAFHCCRSGRWFAPFFARTFGVPASGYQGYTTLSTQPTRFSWERPWSPANTPLYVVACVGKKSHGLLGSAAKYAGIAPLERMHRFEPRPAEGDPTYNSVATLYDQAFADITVRETEWRWLQAHLPNQEKLRLLDLGCGNGALLRELAGRLERGAGVDLSSKMVELARERARPYPQLSFETVEGPVLPFPDASFDVITSLLSFRYLDWDPLLKEIRRVLVPGGRMLIVDMVTVPAKPIEAWKLIQSKVRQLALHAKRPDFRRDLKRLVNHPQWHEMLRHNPIRSEHELRWYLESRFPGRRMEVLDIAWNTRTVAFDTASISTGTFAPQSYP